MTKIIGEPQPWPQTIPEEIAQQYSDTCAVKSQQIIMKTFGVDIPEDQSFYLTDQGIVIYFGLDEISPAANDIPKFLMEFSNFESYIKPRFYCNAKNINFNRMRANYFQQFNRVYY